MSARTPTVLVTGIDADAMAATTVGLQFDLPFAVVLRHTLDVEEQRLTRVVSDVTGVLETVHLDLAHACVACAIREDVVPTLERLAADGRWATIVAHLPVAAEALQVCRVVAAHPDAAPHVEVAAVVAALDRGTVVEDLLGDDLLHERGLHTGEDDGRGVGETATGLVEYADAVVLTGAPTPADDTADDTADHDADHDADAMALLTTLVRPGVPLVPDPSRLDAAPLVAGVHHHRTTERWVDVVRRGALPALDSDRVWRLDLRSDRPFHPGRLLESIERIGGGPRRSRGCFWLPGRPGDACAWDGAGGQLSVGTASPWGLRDPLTRIVVVGLAGDDPREIHDAFEHCLLSDTEIARHGTFWDVAEDGLEPWLGPVRRAA